MICERCKQNQAKTYIKRVQNGENYEGYFCAACAKEMGLGANLGSFPFGLSDFLGQVMGAGVPQKITQQDEQRCPKCGSTFQQFVGAGKAGCENCYAIFYDKLLPSLQRIHGKTVHTGKIPASANIDVKKKRQMEELRQALSAAIENEAFEKAASLRDEIKQLESEEQ